MSTVEANVSRFQGGDFAATYNSSRPVPPTVICGGKPKLVVDLGCGTGISTRIWYNYADLVVGVEPSDDMRAEAEGNSNKLGQDSSKIKFIKGDSGSVSLESGSVDIITCSQSLHWMEPNATFQEAQRLLRPGGIFAAIDCDWPPAINAEAETYYRAFLDGVNEIGKKGAFEGVQKWEKEGHLKRITDSGKFKYTREILVHSIEKGDANRLIGLAMSMGSFGTVIRKGMTLEEVGFTDFKHKVEASMGTKSWDWYIGYRVRLGVK